jgi:HlyD family secretion protein
MQDGKAVRRDVETGISSDADQEIREGLKEGDIVVSGPFRVLRHLQDGEEIEEKEEDEDEDDEAGVVVD